MSSLAGRSTAVTPEPEIELSEAAYQLLQGLGQQASGGQRAGRAAHESVSSPPRPSLRVTEMQESRELWTLLAEYRFLVDLVSNGRARLPVPSTNLSATERTLWAKGLIDVMSDFIEPTRLGRAAVQASHRVIENSAVVFDIVELERAALLLP